MTPRPRPRPSRPVPTPAGLVRHLITTHKRRQLGDLHRRAAWAEQARHAPTLQAWIDTYDDPPGHLGGGRTRSAFTPPAVTRR
jgi:hypothetical protein